MIINYKKILGVFGSVVSLAGIIFSIKRKSVVAAVLFSLTFILSVWFFYTGSKNYAIMMVGASSFLSDKSTPAIEMKNKEELRSFMEKTEKVFLYLPCEKGGLWHKRSVFVFTRYLLPDHDVICPTGRVLIKFNG